MRHSFSESVDVHEINVKHVENTFHDLMLHVDEPMEVAHTVGGDHDIRGGFEMTFRLPFCFETSRH